MLEAHVRQAPARKTCGPAHRIAYALRVSTGDRSYVADTEIRGTGMLSRPAPVMSLPGYNRIARQPPPNRETHLHKVGGAISTAMHGAQWRYQSAAPRRVRTFTMSLMSHTASSDARVIAMEAGDKCLAAEPSPLLYFWKAPSKTVGRTMLCKTTRQCYSHFDRLKPA